MQKILTAAELESEDLVLEIGPGEGVLTEHLLARAARVHVFEIDPQLAQALRERDVDRLVVHEGDFLKQPPPPLDKAPKVVANLPYYITAPILEKLLWSAELPIERAVLMMQHEVALRLTRPAQRESGALTHIAGAFHRLEYLFKVPPGSFAPPPKVDSAVILACPLGNQGDVAKPLKRAFEQVVSTAFQTRRKQLKTSLKTIHPSAQDWLAEAGIDPLRRPETLTTEEFWILARSHPGLQDF